MRRERHRVWVENETKNWQNHIKTYAIFSVLIHPCKMLITSILQKVPKVFKKGTIVLLKKHYRFIKKVLSFYQKKYYRFIKKNTIVLSKKILSFYQKSTIVFLRSQYCYWKKVWFSREKSSIICLEIRKLFLIFVADIWAESSVKCADKAAHTVY